MNEQEIRNIIRQELARDQQMNRFNLSRLQNHQHNGTDSPFIPFSNIAASTSTTGTVTFTKTTKYTFNITFRPKQVLFYGAATNIGASERSFIVGSAQLGTGLYLQPNTNTSVKMGGIKENIIQSSSQIMTVVGTPPTIQVTNDQGHIIDAELSGSVVARATITGFSSNSIVVTVDTLSSGWTITGNFTIM